MKKIHIHIRVPGIRKLGADVVETIFSAVDEVRGIKRLDDGAKLYTNPLPDEAKTTDEIPPRDPAEVAADRILEGTEEKVHSAVQNIISFGTEIMQDIDAICERDPAARSRWEVLLLYSGLHALMFYRLSHALHTSGHYFAARLISQGARFLTGIEIHPGATIGRGLFIDHGSGVVIGETAIVGDNCTLYQGVTLGGTGKDVGKRHPTLGEGVLVGAGAKLLGNFTVGDHAKIAAGAVVLGEVPSNSTAVGIPARVVRRSGERVEDLDQTHIPDPVSQQFCRIGVKLEELENKLAALEEMTAPASDTKTEEIL